MVGPVVGMLLGVVDSVVNHVPAMLGEGGTASAERGGWSQAAEFAGLILDAGWAWAATAVLAGWWGVAPRFWLIASVLLGPPLGVVGAAIGLPGPAGVVAALVVPAGAALQTAVLPPPAASVMAEPVRWSIWIAAVVAAVLVARGFRSRSAVAFPAGAGRGPLGG